MTSDPSYILIVLSILVVFSYLFDLVSRKTSIPSVLLLLLMGIGLQLGWKASGNPMPDLALILPILGTVGLILIVFEGSLDLHYEKGKGKMIRSAFMAAFIILIATSGVTAWLLHVLSGKDLYICLVNAIPLGIISSAIAIPSSATLPKSKREFVIYESSFSDILGIILFNFALANREFHGTSFLILTADILVLTLISAAFCLAVLFMMGRMKHHVKFFLIISVVILIYAVGKSVHLPALLIVMIFGLFLANYHQISEFLAGKFPSLKLLSSLEYKGMNDDLKQLHSLNAESAFLVRTFFFLVFGFSMNIGELLSWHTIVPGLIIAGVIFLIRALYFRYFAKSHFWPEVVISPRGLISILLFMSIPSDLQVIPGISGILILAILCTSLVMTYGLVSQRRVSDRNGP